MRAPCRVEHASVVLPRSLRRSEGFLISMILRPLHAVLYRRAFGGTLLLFIAFMAILLSGAVFLPVASGADEAAHYVYAAAVVRGQAGMLEPMLPARLANIHQFATCIAFQPDVTAACQGAYATASSTQTLTQTNAGLYNPVFYAWTGVGTLLVPTEYGLYISRALAASVTAAFLAWTTSFLARNTRSLLPLASVSLILTPMTLYVGMVLNPSAWEIATLYATAVSGFAVAESSRRKAWSEAHSLLLASGCVLIVTRGLSPLFLAITASIVLIAAGRTRTRRLAIDRRSWIVAGSFALTTALSVIWVLIHGTNYVGVVRPATLGDGITGISVFFSQYHNQIAQMYGTLGWLDLPSPQVLSAAWVFLLGATLVTCFGFAPARHRIAIITAFAAAVLTPGLLAGLQWSGGGWQGRYTLPLVAALVVIGTLTVDTSIAQARRGEAMIWRWEEGMRWLLAGFFAVGTLIVGILAAHRYLSGASAPLEAAWKWTPPLPPAVLALAFLVGVAVITLTIVGRRATR